MARTKTTLRPMDAYQLRILAALQAKPMYLGTVAPAEKARRRKANKAARAARKVAR